MGFSLFPHLRELQLPAPQGVLQIGASYGQEIREFLENGVRAAVCIEPLPEPFAHLASMCRQIPNYLALNTLCTDENGRHYTFHVASNGGMSSSILPPQQHLAVYEAITFDRDVQLVSSTVDQIAAFLRSNGHGAVVDTLDTLYMDCQGAEYRILMGAGGMLRQIKYIYTEVMRGDLYAGQVPLLNYCMHLDAMGYTLNDLYFHHPGQAGNALFIRKDLVAVPRAH
jgi:FkbM family methyltransferase